MKRGACPFCNRKGYGFISNYPVYGQWTCEFCYYVKIHWFGHAWKLIWRNTKWHNPKLKRIKMFVRWFVCYYLK